MTYNDLSKGMVVRLTSGGPQMTVENYKGVSWTVNRIKKYYDDPVSLPIGSGKEPRFQ